MRRWSPDLFRPGQSGMVGEMFVQLDFCNEFCHKHGPPVRAVLPNSPPLTRKDYDAFEEIERWKRLPREIRDQIMAEENARSREQAFAYAQERAAIAAKSREETARVSALRKKAAAKRESQKRLAQKAVELAERTPVRVAIKQWIEMPGRYTLEYVGAPYAGETRIFCPWCTSSNYWLYRVTDAPGGACYAERCGTCQGSRAYRLITCDSPPSTPP